ncbi:MAG: hypothetical protein WCF67_16110 [Chitinophagaceae bacterium]
MKTKLLLIICMSLFLFACKKTGVQTPGVPPASGLLKLPLGQPTGNAITKEIGAEGGTLQSSDGVMKLTIPAGAVQNATLFSIQPVENTLGSKAKSYRLKPEGVSFKKPVTITYNYSSINTGTIDPKYLFLACQDQQGYYYSAKHTKGNKANHTLTVETTHFSDWTFYAMYEFYIREGNVVDGKIVLGEDESAELIITRLTPKTSDGDLDALLAPLADPVITAAGWDFLPKKGTLTVSQREGKGVYRAPKIISSQQDVIVTAMMNGDLGKDNEGNPVRQMQLSQPIRLVTGDYFILKEDGVEMNATDFSAELIHLYGVEMNARFSNGYNLSCYVYATSPGNYGYNMHGTPGKASMELVPADGKSYIVFRPDRCDQPGELVFSPGSFILTSVANSVGQYFEGSFSATLYKFSYCESGGTKTISGKFRFRKKV